MQPEMSNLRHALLALLVLALPFPAVSAAPSPNSASPTYTYKVISSPDGRPTPFPTAGLVTLIADDGNQYQPQDLFWLAFASSSGTVIDQVVTYYGPNYDEVVFRTDNDSQIQLFHPDGQRMIVDNDGLRIWNAVGDTQLHLPVTNLAHTIKSAEKAQIAAKPALTAAAKPAFGTAPANLKVEVDYHNQCGNPILGHKANATCYIYNYAEDSPLISSETIDLVGGGHDGAYTGSCAVPSKGFLKAAATTCRTTAKKTIIAYALNGIAAHFKQLDSDLGILGDIITSGVIPANSTNGAASFDISAVAAALQSFYVYVETVRLAGIHYTVEYLCLYVQEYTVYVDAQLDIQDGPIKIPVEGPPYLPYPSGIIATQTVSIASVVCSSATPSA